MSVQFGERLGWTGSITDVSDSPKEMLGVRRIELGDEGRKVYVYVHNGEASDSLDEGMLAKWEDVDEAEVQRGDGAGNLIAGVAIADIPAGEYGWIQTSGYHEAIDADGSTAAGDAMIADGTSAGRVAAGDAPTRRVVAWAMDEESDGAAPGYIVLE